MTFAQFNGELAAMLSWFSVNWSVDE